jgi:hypothetical protein
VTAPQAQLATLIFILVITLVVVAWDIAMVQVFGAEASVSRVIGRLNQRYPTVFVAIIFGLGVFVGHTWLPNFAQ